MLPCAKRARAIVSGARPQLPGVHAAERRCLKPPHPGPTDGTKSLPAALAQLASAPQLAGLLAYDTASEAK